MDWMEDVQHNWKRRNQILVSKDNPLLLSLEALLHGQSHRAAVLWALELSEEIVQTLEAALPGELRPRAALDAARQWAAGAIKMRPAQRAILDCHGLAKALSDPVLIALCHAVGQGCAVVHTAGHWPGLPMYELTALVRQYGPDACRQPVEDRASHYAERLVFWIAREPDFPGPWAPFLAGPSVFGKKV